MLGFCSESEYYSAFASRVYSFWLRRISLSASSVDYDSEEKERGLEKSLTGFQISLFAKQIIKRQTISKETFAIQALKSCQVVVQAFAIINFYFDIFHLLII